MKKSKLRTILGARRLRRRSTPAESLLWKYLSNKGMCGVKFRRQHPIDGFVVDFYSPAKRLVIEIDGGIHRKQKEQDLIRQNIIESNNVRFLRFKNKEVFQNIDNVLKIIKRTIFPSPRSGEGCPDEVGAG